MVVRKKRDPLARIKARPEPKQWDDDEPMTLVEAVALFFPDGPLTLSSLRKEAAEGHLATRRVAGKDLTTKRALRELVTPCRVERRNPLVSSQGESGAVKGSGSSATENGKSAQAAASKTLKALRQRLRTTSPPSTSQPSASATPPQLRVLT